MFVRTARLLAGFVMLVAAMVVGGSATATAAEAQPLAKLSHSQATAQFSAAGLTWSSSGGCSDRQNPTCTSFDQINSATVDGGITFKQASGCAVNLTGGTEVGHASGTYSHYNGYKLDWSLSSCIDNYIYNNYTAIGGSKWEAPSGNIYYREGNHWDVTFYSCGGC